MHRSSSTTRFSDEFYNHSSSSSSSPSPALRATTTTATTAATPTTDHDELPLYNPDSHLAKKERSRLRSAENAIHLIPVILVVCAVILWSFSKPAVDLVNKDDSNVPRIKGLTTMDANTDGDGSQSGLLLDSKLEVTDPGKVDHQKDKH